METIKLSGLLIAGWFIFIGLYMPLHMRNKREKIKGITYNQLVALCVVMVVSGLVMLVGHFLWKN